MQKSAREVLRDKHLIRAGSIFAFGLIEGAAGCVRFGVTTVELPSGTEVVHAELAIERFVFYVATRFIDCDNFEESSAGQLLISDRNFGQNFIHRLVISVL